MLTNRFITDRSVFEQPFALASKTYPVNGFTGVQQSEAISSERRAWECSPEYQLRQQQLSDINGRAAIEESTASFATGSDGNQFEVLRADKNNQSAFTAKTLIYTPTIPEYPITHPDGVLYVISAQGLTPTQKQKPWINVSIPCIFNRYSLNIY